jgi:pre-mRNA-splicing factor 18
MDALKAEIAAKRKALQDDPVYAARPTKYMRRGEIEKLKEEQEIKAREQKESAASEQAAFTTAVKVCLTNILSSV